MLVIVIIVVVIMINNNNNNNGGLPQEVIVLLIMTKHWGNCCIHRSSPIHIILMSSETLHEKMSFIFHLKQSLVASLFIFRANPKDKPKLLLSIWRTLPTMAIQDVNNISRFASRHLGLGSDLIIRLIYLFCVHREAIPPQLKELRRILGPIQLNIA